MKKYLFWVTIAIIAVAAGLGVNYAAHDIIRDALARAYQAIHTAANAIPQPWYIVFLVLVILISAARSLLGDEGGRPRQRVEPGGGRAAEWHEWLVRADQPTGGRLFYRWRVARSLARLAGEVVAHEEGISPGEAERLIEDGDVVLPPAIQSYFLTSMRSRPTLSGGWWSRLPRGRPAGPLDLDPSQAVEWIETQMEVPHDNQHP